MVRYPFPGGKDAASLTGLAVRDGLLVASLPKQGQLLFDEVLQRVADDAEVVLSEQIRHSILQVTHG